MTPIGEFESSLNKLRIVFKVISQDVFAPEFHYGLSFYIINIFLILTDIFYLCIAMDQEHYDTATRYSSIAMFCGFMQV